MEKFGNALTEYESFVVELIALYKETPVLWKRTHPNYRSRTERINAYKPIIAKAQEYFPEADEDFVKMKIDSWRSSVRKEWRKVFHSKNKSTNSEDIYKPSLWYYNRLLFTIEEEAENGVNGHENETQEVSVVAKKKNGNFVRIPTIWNREHAAILINLYKKTPSLYVTSHPLYYSQKRRKETFKKITEKLMSMTGKSFHMEEVRRKIYLLRHQYVHEYNRTKRSENAGEVYESSLWCYDLLGFLKEEFQRKKRRYLRDVESIRRINGRRKCNDERTGEEENIKTESDLNNVFQVSEDDSSPVAEDDSSPVAEDDSSPVAEDEDIFDTIGKNLAHQLREMGEQQRDIANKIIREVMYHGQMENLTHNSRFSLNGS